MVERGKFAAANLTDAAEAHGEQIEARISAFPDTSPSAERPAFASSSLFRKIFSFNTLLVFLLLGAVAGTIYLNIKSAADAPALEARYAIFEGDTWWHLAVGNHILNTHSWPTTDQYSFTANGDSWIAYEWVGEVVIAAAGRLRGLEGMTILMVSLCALIVLLMFYYAYLRSRNSKAAFAACALLLPLAVVSFTLRPQLLGYVLMLVTLIWLEKFRQGMVKTLWLLPPLFAVWVNTHGMFMFGIFFLVVYYISGLSSLEIGAVRMERWTDRQRRHLGLITLLSVAALTVTPYGTFLAGRYLEMSFSQPLNLASFQEWRPPDVTQFYGILLIAMILLFVLAPLFVKTEYKLEEAALLLTGIIAACIHVRFVILFAVVFAPFLATLFARYAPPYSARNDKPVLNLVLISLIVFGCIKFFPSRLTLDKVVSHGFPSGAVTYIRNHPSLGPIFNEEFWGGYLITQLGPREKVFMDGRADLYEPAGVLSDYLSIIQIAPNTRFLLRKYHVQACLIEPGSPLATLLAELPEWKRVYSDGVSVIFVRKPDAAKEHVGTGIARLKA